MAVYKMSTDVDLNDYLTIKQKHEFKNDCIKHVKIGYVRNHAFVSPVKNLTIVAGIKYLKY